MGRRQPLTWVNWASGSNDPAAFQPDREPAPIRAPTPARPGKTAPVPHCFRTVIYFDPGAETMGFASRCKIGNRAPEPHFRPANTGDFSISRPGNRPPEPVQKRCSFGFRRARSDPLAVSGGAVLIGPTGAATLKSVLTGRHECRRYDPWPTFQRTKPTRTAPLFRTGNGPVLVLSLLLWRIGHSIEPRDRPEPGKLNRFCTIFEPLFISCLVPFCAHRGTPGPSPGRTNRASPGLARNRSLPGGKTCSTDFPESSEGRAKAWPYSHILAHYTRTTPHVITHEIFQKSWTLSGRRQPSRFPALVRAKP